MKRISSKWNYYFACFLLFFAFPLIVYYAINRSNYILLILVIITGIIFFAILSKIYLLKFDNETVYLHNIFENVKLPFSQVIKIEFNPLLINKGFQMHYGYTIKYLNANRKEKTVWFFVPQSRIVKLQELKKNLQHQERTSEEG